VYERLPIDLLDFVIALGDQTIITSIADHFRRDSQVLIRILETTPEALEHLRDRWIDGSCEQVRDLMMLHGLGRKLSLYSLSPEFIAAYEDDLSLPCRAYNDLCVEKTLRVFTILKREYDIRSMVNNHTRMFERGVYLAYLASQSDEYVQRYVRIANMHQRLTGEPAVLP
jgi:hypothetical protein